MQVQIGFGKYIKQLSHLATNLIKKKKKALLNNIG